MKAKVSNQIMAPLSSVLIKKTLHAFARVAVDHVGTLISIQGKGWKRSKKCSCLFTCLKSCAIHLEIAYCVDTDSFLNGFFLDVKSKRTSLRSNVRRIKRVN